MFFNHNVVLLRNFWREGFVSGSTWRRESPALGQVSRRVRGNDDESKELKQSAGRGDLDLKNCTEAANGSSGTGGERPQWMAERSRDWYTFFPA